MCLASTYNIKQLDLDGESNLALGHWVQALFFFNTIRAQEHFFQHIQVIFPLNVLIRYPQYLTPRPRVKSRSRSMAH